MHRPKYLNRMSIAHAELDGDFTASDLRQIVIKLESLQRYLDKGPESYDDYSASDDEPLMYIGRSHD